MTERQSVLLTVLVETVKRRWYVAGVTLDGQAVPLMCSEAGNLDPYVGVVLDEQVNFLRHRLSGVLQRGYDRLWSRQMKPCQIVFVADDEFQQAGSDLTQRVADHFVEWMSNPPVTFFTCQDGWSNSTGPTLHQLAGNLDHADQEALAKGLPQLVAALDDSDLWELTPNKPTA